MEKIDNNSPLAQEFCKSFKKDVIMANWMRGKVRFNPEKPLVKEFEIRELYSVGEFILCVMHIVYWEYLGNWGSYDWEKVGKTQYFCKVGDRILSENEFYCRKKFDKVFWWTLEKNEEALKNWIRQVVLGQSLPLGNIEVKKWDSISFGNGFAAVYPSRFYLEGNATQINRELVHRVIKAICETRGDGYSGYVFESDARCADIVISADQKSAYFILLDESIGMGGIFGSHNNWEEVVYKIWIDAWNELNGYAKAVGNGSTDPRRHKLHYRFVLRSGDDGTISLSTKKRIGSPDGEVEEEITILD